MIALSKLQKVPAWQAYLLRNTRWEDNGDGTMTPHWAYLERRLSDETYNAIVMALEFFIGKNREELFTHYPELAVKFIRDCAARWGARPEPVLAFFGFVHRTTARSYDEWLHIEHHTESCPGFLYDDPETRAAHELACLVYEHRGASTYFVPRRDRDRSC